MIHLVLPFALASVLAGAGVHAILARRNAVLMLIGVELVLAAAGLVLVTTSAVLPDRDSAGQILAVFIITLAAAEVTLALGIILFAFRQRGHIDLTRGLFEDEDGDEGVDVADDDAAGQSPDVVADVTSARAATTDSATSDVTTTGTATSDSTPSDVTIVDATTTPETPEGSRSDTPEAGA